MDIAITGAGLAGLCAARALRAEGHAVVVFDKSGGIGGRVATRRTDHGAFDHGARVLHGIPDEIRAATGSAASSFETGLVGLPGNSGFARALAAGIDVRGRHRVTLLSLDRDMRWTLGFEDGTRTNGFGAVLICIPQPQALALFETSGMDADTAFSGLAEVTMRPCWTLMAAFDDPVEAPDWLEIADPPATARREAAKPGRGPAETWAVQADAGWSEAHLEEAAEDVAAKLVAGFRAATGAPAPAYAAAHRWRFARTGQPLGRPCLWDADHRIGLAGDWCLGAAAGDAVASGTALAAAVNGRVSQ